MFALIFCGWFVGFYVISSHRIIKKLQIPNMIMPTLNVLSRLFAFAGCLLYKKQDCRFWQSVDECRTISDMSY